MINLWNDIQYENRETSQATTPTEGSENRPKTTGVGGAPVSLLNDTPFLTGLLS